MEEQAKDGSAHTALLANNMCHGKTHNIFKTRATSCIEIRRKLCISDGRRSKKPAKKKKASKVVG